MQFKNYFAIAVFFVTLSLFVLILSQQPSVSIKQSDGTSLEGLSALGVTDLWQQGGDSCDDSSKSDLVARAAGRTPPGGCCKKNSDCAFNNNGAGCNCHRTGTQLRCCSIGGGHVCHSNDECASNVCQNGVCTTGTRPAGTTCTNNEECTSGLCILVHMPNTHWQCT